MSLCIGYKLPYVKKQLDEKKKATGWYFWLSLPFWISRQDLNAETVEMDSKGFYLIFIVNNFVL